MFVTYNNISECDYLIPSLCNKSMLRFHDIHPVLYAWFLPSL
jgi:hypothetical protein